MQDNILTQEQGQNIEPNIMQDRILIQVQPWITQELLQSVAHQDRKNRP